MDYKKNKALPWITFAASIIYSVLNVLMSIVLNIDVGITPTRIVVFSLFGAAIILIVLALVTARVNRIYDPMTERAEALSLRYIGFAALLGFLPVLIQLLLYAFVPGFVDLANDAPARASFILTVLTIYIIGFPFVLITIRRIPAMKIEKRKMTFSFFILCVAVMAGLCMAGVLIGLPIEMLLTTPFESDSADEISNIAEIMQNSSLFDRVLVVGIMAPVFEELIFRKLLVSRTIRYGETMSILLSGFMFGLFHGNFQQFFFASFVGMLFAFVYIRTGHITYTILMHMIVNLSTSVVTTTLYIKLLPYLDDTTDISSMPSDVMLLFLVLCMWMMLLVAIAITGFVLLFIFNKRFKPYRRPDEPSLGKIIGNLLRSPALWSFIVIELSEFASYYLPDIVSFFL